MEATLYGSMCIHIRICTREIMCLRLRELACMLTDNSEDVSWPWRYLLLVRTVLTRVLGVHEPEEWRRAWDGVCCVLTVTPFIPKTQSQLLSDWRRRFSLQMKAAQRPCLLPPYHRCAVLQLLLLCHSSRSHFPTYIIVQMVVMHSCCATSRSERLGSAEQQAQQELIIKKLSGWKFK